MEGREEAKKGEGSREGEEGANKGRKPEIEIFLECGEPKTSEMTKRVFSLYNCTYTLCTLVQLFLEGRLFSFSFGRGGGESQVLPPSTRP